MDIDVLVQLAYLGPGDAEKWQPLTDDPDATGSLLWARNYESAADPEHDGTVPGYRFEPLPITITAAEGIKQCEFYRYQTETDGDWARDGVGRLLRRLRAHLIEAMPEHRAAPWGWGPRELAEREGRPRPLLPQPPEAVDPRVARWLQLWNDAGMPLIRGEPARDLRAMFPDPRDLLAYGYYRPAGQSGFAPVVAVCCATEASAERLFSGRVKQHQTERFNDVHVYRWGAGAAVTKFLLPYEAHFVPLIDQRIARLGPPDQHWWSQAPPLRRLDAEVIAVRVRLSPARAGTHSDARAVYARTPKQLDALALYMEDAEVRDLVAGIDTRKQSVVLLRGVSEIGSVQTVKIEEELIDRGAGDALDHAMYFSTEGASMATGTLLVMDRLQKTPGRATILDRYLRQAMIADVPRPLA